MITNASGYDNTTRTTPVIADEDGITPTVTTADFKLDASDPTPPDSISVLVTATEGGIIETPDGRFAAVIPPDALSGDAIITLMTPEDGPTVVPGDELTLDPDLGLSDVKALGKPVQLVVEPADQGDPIPTIEGWILLTGRYFQSYVDTYNLDESTAFPYYWDGTQWTVLEIGPDQMTVDEINNMPMAFVGLYATITGDPVTAKLGTREPILLASLDNYIPNMFWAVKYNLILAAIIKEAPAEPNVKIYDKNELGPVQDVIGDEFFEPDPNALPFLLIHGWVGEHIIKNKSRTVEGYDDQGVFDPDKANGYAYILQDLISATNGVYRPMFISYNGRAPLNSVGNAAAKAYKNMNIKGDPAEPSDSNSGSFPYVDTIGYSKGGLVSRSFQAISQSVHNMIMIATPNHGTFNLSKLLDQTLIMKWSPGTKDLLAYDDSKSEDETENPTLYYLNKNPACIPMGDMTLIAGTDNSDIFLPGSCPGLEEPNDGIVPLISVFCRPTCCPDDPNQSLLKVKGPDSSDKYTSDRSARKFEYNFPFNHGNFGERDYRLEAHPEIRNKIITGLSDWVVAKTTNSQIDKYPSPDDEYIMYSEFEAEIQYNVFKQTDQSDPRQSRDIDRVALLIYGQDENDNWHLGGSYTDDQGNLLYSDSISGNSIDLAQPLKVSTSAVFNEDQKIVKVEFEVLPIHSDKPTVPLEPSGKYKMPEKPQTP
ncbi:MAG: hypothetical protein K9L30_07230 [Desulfobacterales bacterium]|nr:hypothetical protein [Desulfobacterales bacterium]